MHWNIFNKERYDLLKRITENLSLNNYYMIGGTALSLQLGLRESFDFDFCVQNEFNNEILLKELNKIGKCEVMQNQNGTLDVTMNGIQVSFFYYPNKLIEDFVKTGEIPNLKIASVIDIAIMKIVAIGGRGAKKDFFDLYNIIKKCNIKSEELARGLVKKCGGAINYMYMVMGLTYFEDAEEEILPKTFVNYDWEEIKKFFMKFQIEFKKDIEMLIG